MKVNKVSHWIYCILMLLPFLMVLGYMLYGVLTRTGTIIGGTIDSPTAYFSGCWESVIYSGHFDWVESSPFFTSIDDFCNLFHLNMFGCEYLFTYMITISVGYLGIEVLLAFINIARKLVYAFVDKEF